MKYAKIDLEEEFNRWVDEHDGELPTYRAWVAHSDYPSVNPVLRVFGKWNGFLKSISGEVNVESNISCEMLVGEYYRWVKEFGKPPTYDAWGANSDYPSIAPVKRLFGSWSKFVAKMNGEERVLEDFLDGELE